MTFFALNSGKQITTPSTNFPKKKKNYRNMATHTNTTNFGKN